MKIEDYLTQEEMKEIAIEEFKKTLDTDNKRERILTNMSYNLGYGLIKEIITAEELEEIKRKTKNMLLNDKTALSMAVYNKPDVWDMKRKDDLVVYNEIQKAIRENIDLVRERVILELKNIDLDKFQEEFNLSVIFELLLKNINR